MSKKTQATRDAAAKQHRKLKRKYNLRGKFISYPKDGSFKKDLRYSRAHGKVL